MISSLDADAANRAIAVAVIGAHGHGRRHLQNLEHLTDKGIAELVGVVDIADPPNHLRKMHYHSLTALLHARSNKRPEAVIISTPIDTHVPIARQALAAGCHVYLEKPPTPSLSDHWRLLEDSQRAHRAIQVGFQSHGGAGIQSLRARLKGGAYGEISTVRVHGAWLRKQSYYRRSPWAGKRRLHQRIVADGVATNPLAHGVDAALRIAGIERVEHIESITTELRRANDIEADDTSFVRIDPFGGRPPVVCALTTAAPEHQAPHVEVVGTNGFERLYHTLDYSEGEIDGKPFERTFQRSDLVENFFKHINEPRIALLSPLRLTESFTTVLDAIQSAPDPLQIDEEYVTWVGEGPDSHPIVNGIDAALQSALELGRPFSNDGVTWARPEAVTIYRPQQSTLT